MIFVSYTDESGVGNNTGPFNGHAHEWTRDALRNTADELIESYRAHLIEADEGYADGPTPAAQDAP